MSFLIAAALTLVAYFGASDAFADSWHRADNRTKGKTQQCRPVEPIDFFAIKPVKG